MGVVSAEFVRQSWGFDLEWDLECKGCGMCVICCVCV